MEHFWAKKNTKTHKKNFRKFNVTTVIQKEKKWFVFCFCFSFFRTNRIISKNLFFGPYWIQNWLALHFLFHCFIFPAVPDTFNITTGGSLLLRTSRPSFSERHFPVFQINKSTASPDCHNNTFFADDSLSCRQAITKVTNHSFLLICFERIIQNDFPKD